MEAENDKMKSTGERIKALLNEKKMTQRQLAELSGNRKCYIALHQRRPYSFRSRISKYRLCIKYNNQLYFRQGRFIRFF